MYTIIKNNLIQVDCSLAGCWQYEIVRAKSPKESLGTYQECKKLIKEYETEDELLMLFG